MSRTFICLLHRSTPSFSHFLLFFSQFPAKRNAVVQTFQHITRRSRTDCGPKPLLVATRTEGIICGNGIPCFGNVATSGVRRRGLCPSGSTASETFALFCSCAFLCEPVRCPDFTIAASSYITTDFNQIRRTPSPNTMNKKVAVAIAAAVVVVVMIIEIKTLRRNIRNEVSASAL